MSLTVDPCDAVPKSGFGSISKTNLRLAIVFEAALIVVALFVGALLGSPPFTEFEITWRGLLWGLGATAIPLAILWFALQYEGSALARLARFARDKFASMFEGASLSELALLSAFAGIGEEALFRGAIQGALVQHLDPWLGVVAASFIFGLVHFVTASYAVFAGIFGLYLGWLAIAHNNLFVPIVVHAVYDFFALIWLLQGNRFKRVSL